MNSTVRNKTRSISVLVVSFIIFMAMLSPCAWGYSEQMRKGFLKGPWQLVVAVGHEGREMSFPITVSDENKSEKLDLSFPVLGTPIEVKLKQYTPKLEWKNSIIEQADGGIVAAIKIKGAGDMVQDMLLDSADSERQSISSPIGGVAIKKVHKADTLNQLAQKYKSGKTVGIVSVWLKDSKEPIEFLANLNEPINIPNTKYKLEVLEYLPHCTVDTQTKEVSSLSQEPLNPAAKIKFDDGETSHEQLLWAKFPTSPHVKVKLPLRVEFAEIDTGGKQGNYVVLAAPNSEARIVFIKDQKTVVEKLEHGKYYSFNREDFTFSIEKIVNNAVIETKWTDVSGNLSNPAMIGAIVTNGIEQEVVLELNKPFHKNSSFGTMVLLYKNQGASSAMGN
ncbi:MAG: hypothetical protein ACYST9_01530 [Planctomycetota bacterium]|jgi:hypothetical protein